MSIVSVYGCALGSVVAFLFDPSLSSVVSVIKIFVGSSLSCLCLQVGGGSGVLSRAGVVVIMRLIASPGR